MAHREKGKIMSIFYGILMLFALSTCWLVVMPLLSNAALPKALRLRASLAISLAILLVGLGLYLWFGVPEIVRYTG